MAWFLVARPQFRTMPEGSDHWEVDMPKDCLMIIGEERVRTITICANVVLAEFNRNNSVCARKLCVGHYRIHCNFCAKTEGEIRWKHFFAEAEFKNGSCTVIGHELLTYGKVKEGCDMCSTSILHPSSRKT
ncbi:hypothetical protein OROMI_001827 [Orobanche minor]